MKKIVLFILKGILSFLLTLVLSLLFSVLLRVDKKKNNGQSIEQFTITQQSAAGSDDQIIQHDKNELDLATQIEIKLQQDKNRLRHVYDGLNYYDPYLLHPVVNQFCCCPVKNDYTDEENLVNAEMRVLSRRPSHVPIVTSTENVHLDPDAAPIVNVIKQRRASIYTVASDQNQIDLQRRMSRLSRQSSGRSEYGGPNLTVPVMSNVSNAEVTAVITAEVVENSRNLNVLQTPTFQQRVIASPNLARAKTITHNRLAERRKSHVANVDLSDVEPIIPKPKNLGRRQSLSPNIISQINVPPMNIQRGGSFRKSDRRLSQVPGYSIGVQNELVPEPVPVVPDNSMIQEINTNPANQLLQVPGSFDREESNTGSPRRVIPPNIINSNLIPNEGTLNLNPEEMATQRRFSVVNEAMERHNTRRKNKRSQSVMYRPGQGKRVAKTLSEKS